MGVEVVLDRGDQVGDAVEDAAAERLVGELAEPALDQVQPRRRGRGEVQVEPRVLGQPGLDVGVLVGGVVVQDQVDLQALGDLAVDGLAGTSGTPRGGAGAGTGRSPCR